MQRLSLIGRPPSVGALAKLIASPDRRTSNADHATIHQTIRRATAIMETLWTRVVPSRLSDIARATKLDRSTALRLLSSLEELGYVHRDRDTKIYRIGYMAQRLGARPQMLSVNTALAMPFLQELAGRTGETVVGAALEGVSVLYHCCIAGAVQARPLIVRIGVAYDAHACAAGKMLLGNHSTAALNDLYSQTRLDRHASRTITDRDVLARQAHDARNHGFSMELDEAEEGRAGIAVPVVNSRGTANMTIGILLRPTSDLWQDHSRLLKECQATAKQIYHHVLC